MAAYEKLEINGKTVFVPVDQPAQPVIPNKPLIKKTPHAPKLVGKQYGERKNWW